MSNDKNWTSYVIDRSKLDINYPTNYHDPNLWQELGRAVAAFGFLEEILGKAIFALTASSKIDAQDKDKAFADWISTLKKALTDQLGGLVAAYEKALRKNRRTQEIDFSELIGKLKDAKDIRNVLCHGSWRKPDVEGRTIPAFVNRDLKVFETPIDINFLRRTRSALRDLICDVLDSITWAGYQFPGSQSPGEQLWPPLDNS